MALYRVLLAPDTEDHPWPKGVRVGSGAKTIALLNDVPIWFELWRQLNGFPPNFYTASIGLPIKRKNKMNLRLISCTSVCFVVLQLRGNSQDLSVIIV